jgi:hypothetical protein
MIEEGTSRPIGEGYAHLGPCSELPDEEVEAGGRRGNSVAVGRIAGISTYPVPDVLRASRSDMVSVVAPVDVRVAVKRRSSMKLNDTERANTIRTEQRDSAPIPRLCRCPAIGRFIGASGIWKMRWRKGPSRFQDRDRLSTRTPNLWVRESAPRAGSEKHGGLPPLDRLLGIVIRSFMRRSCRSDSAAPPLASNHHCWSRGTEFVDRPRKISISTTGAQ